MCYGFWYSLATAYTQQIAFYNFLEFKKYTLSQA